VFYAQGQVVCGEKLGDDVLDVLAAQGLIPALRTRPSLIVITQPWVLTLIQRTKGLIMDPEPVACEREECAARVSLQPGFSAKPAEPASPARRRKRASPP
ncbi:MAG TPA: hypothetical protein VI756_14795, partial [Blastocatellia bacterium]